MNSRQLRYLKIIAETGSIQAASFLLEKNPSTLTRFLKNANQEYGTTVFEKKNGELILTPEGEVIMEYVHGVLTLLEELNDWIDQERERLGIICDELEEIDWADTDVRYLIEVRREGNISNAAAKMFISQPSLSQRLNEIEQKLGFPVFVRHKYGVEETANGKVLLDRMNRIQKRDNALRRDLDEFTQMRRGEAKADVAFGVLPQMGACLLPVVLPTFMDRYPGVKISFAEHDDKHLEAMLLKGKLDFCILSFYPKEHEDWMMFEDFFEDRMYLIVPETMQEQFTFKIGQELGPNEIQQLDGMPFIVPEISQELETMINNILERSGAEVNVRFTTRHVETARRLASAGAGVTLMPLSCLAWRSSVEQANYYPLSKEFNAIWNLQTVYHTERGLSLAAREFIRLLRDGLEQIC